MAGALAHSCPPPTQQPPSLIVRQPVRDLVVTVCSYILFSFMRVPVLVAECQVGPSSCFCLLDALARWCQKSHFSCLQGDLWTGAGLQHAASGAKRIHGRLATPIWPMGRAKRCRARHAAKRSGCQLYEALGQPDVWQMGVDRPCLAHAIHGVVQSRGAALRISPPLFLVATRTAFCFFLSSRPLAI